MKRHPLSLIFVCWIVCLSAGFPALAQNQGDSLRDLLPNELPLLKNRITMSFPAGAVDVPRPHDILSPAPAEDQETRITWTLDKQRMVVFVQEMNALSTVHLPEDVMSLYTPAERSEYVFREITTRGGLRAVLTTPLRRDSSQDAILIRSVLIQTSDSTLIQAGVYLNPAACMELPKYLALSEVILTSAKAGTRKPVLKARTEKLPVLGSPDSLHIRLPANYIVITSRGFDFITYQIRRLEPLTNHAQGGLIVYTGLQPVPVKDMYGFSAGNRSDKKGRLWEKDMIWDAYSDKAKGIFLLEHLLKADNWGPGLQIQTAIVAANQAELESLCRIAEKMSVSK